MLWVTKSWLWFVRGASDIPWYSWLLLRHSWSQGQHLSHPWRRAETVCSGEGQIPGVGRKRKTWCSCRWLNLAYFPGFPHFYCSVFSALPLCTTANTTGWILIREGRRRGGGRGEEERGATNEPKLLCSSLYNANLMKSISGERGVEKGNWGGEEREKMEERHGKKQWTSALYYCFCIP